MMQIVGAWITTIGDPCGYSVEQIDRACAVAHRLRRGRFVLVEPPAFEALREPDRDVE